MAAGDIVSCTVLATGWEAQVVIEGLSDGGTYAMDGSGATLTDTSTAKVKFTVVSEGYDATGTLGTKTRYVYGTRARMKAYPNENTAEEAEGGGNLTVTLALSDYIYDDDNTGAGKSGTAPTVNIAAGFYTEAGGDGGTANSASSATFAVTNNSTQDYPKVIARWASVPYQRFTSTFDLECVAFHRFAESGKPVACVKFEAYEGASQITEDIVTAMVQSSAEDALPCYKQTITASNYTDNAVVTCEFTAYPWVGDADSKLTTIGGTANAVDLGPLPLYADSNDNVAVYYAVINTSTGNDTTGAASTTYATAAAAPYATIRKALGGIGTANGGSADFAEILIQSNNVPSFTGTSSTVTTTNGWVTITRDYKAASPVAKANAVIAGTGTNGVTTAHLRLYDLTLAPTGGMLTGAAGRSIWYDHVAQDGNGTQITANLHSSFPIVYGTFSTSDECDFPWAVTLNQDAPLIRGCSATLAKGVVQSATYAPRCLLTTTIDSGHSRVGPSSAIAFANTVAAYNRFLAKTNTASAFGAQAALTDIAMVCNLVEKTGDASTSAVSLWDDGNASATSNILVWHNTVVGQRLNFGYNEAASNTARSNCILAFNAVEEYNSKHDDFNADGTYIGAWSVAYGVGYRGNHAENEPVAGTDERYFGIGSTLGTEAAGYTDDQSLTTSGTGSTASTADANYLPAVGSVLRGKIATAADVVIPWDLAGLAYESGGAAGAYTFESLVPELEEPGAGATVIAGIVPSAAQYFFQHATPNGDIADGNWLHDGGTNVNMCFHINDGSVYDDADYIRSGATPANDTYICEMTPIVTPEAGTVTLKVRARYL